jgi:hypothetical protein
MRTSNSTRKAGGIAVADLLLAAQARAIIANDFTGVVVNQASDNPGPYLAESEFSVASGSSTLNPGIYAIVAANYGNGAEIVSLYNSGYVPHTGPPPAPGS